MNWKPIPGYEGRYEVSAAGLVRSRLGRGAHLLRASASNRTGHLAVHLYTDGKSRTTYVHQLVAAAFIGPRPAGMEVRHLDSNPENNSLCNLAYGTRGEQRRDDVRHGSHFNARKTHCAQGHEYTPENTYVRTDWRGTRRYCRACRAAWKQAAKAVMKETAA